MTDAATVEANAAVTARLEALVSRLTEADLARDLGGGWTVSVALSHLAFWDRRITFVLDRWMRDGTPHVEFDDEVVNYALEAIHAAVDPRMAGLLAIESAKATDAAIARTPDAIANQLIAEGNTYLLARKNHRTEHIEQIEAAL